MLTLNPKANNTDRRIIFHVDMDSFFASIEVRERPELKGLPVVVGSDPKGGSGRGVVSTCSYEARKYGIHSAMPISQAYKLCPNAAFVPVHMKLYAGVSANVMEILKGFAEKFQQSVWMKHTLYQDQRSEVLKKLRREKIYILKG